MIWGHIFDGVEKAVGQQLGIVVSEIQQNRFKRWQAIGMFKHILISMEYPWIIKAQCMDILLSIIDGIISEEQNDSVDDLSSFLLNLFSSIMVTSSFLSD